MSNTTPNDIVDYSLNLESLKSKIAGRIVIESEKLKEGYFKEGGEKKQVNRINKMILLNELFNGIDDPRTPNLQLQKLIDFAINIGELEQIPLVDFRIVQTTVRQGQNSVTPESIGDVIGTYKAKKIFTVEQTRNADAVADGINPVNTDAGDYYGVFIPKPGVGKAIIILNYSITTKGGSENWSVPGPAQLYIESPSGLAAISGAGLSGSIDINIPKIALGIGTIGFFGNKSVLENKAITFENPSGAITGNATGDAEIIIEAHYKIIDVS